MWKNEHLSPIPKPLSKELSGSVKHVNPKMDMQKIVTLDGFGVRKDPREHLAKNATLNKNQL